MIAIIDSGGANIASVQFALQRLGADSILTTDANQIKTAKRVLLPGVGAAPVAMQKLRESKLINVINTLRQPVLGICLGMQLLFSHSSEGNTNMLDLIEGNCKAFKPTPKLSVPHMGWNKLHPIISHPLLAGLPIEPHVYFVHSYFVPITSSTIASCNYGKNFTAVIAKNNFFGCQFHPERSGKVGERILKNFLELTL